MIATKKSNMSEKKSILERLAEGPVIGDGGYVIALEKRGYVKAGPWTPEATIEHPDAVLGLHKEFINAGSDVIQTFTFYSSDEKLKFGGNDSAQYTSEAINEKGCNLALEAAKNSNTLVAASLSTCVAYTEGKGKAIVQEEFKKQTDRFAQHNIDFIICEFIHSVEEMEWAIEVALTTGLTVASTMSIGPDGDLNGIELGECAVRMAKAGSSIVGVNCMFDTVTTIQSIRTIKEALDEAGLKPFLMTQPNGFHTPGTGKLGWFEIPEYPFAMEHRQATRWDVHKYAREAFDLGVRYIGGCCGFEAYHIRAIAEELSEERGGRLPGASAKHSPWGEALDLSSFDFLRNRSGREYWNAIKPFGGYTVPTKDNSV